MKNSRSAILFTLIITILTGMFFESCRSRSMDGMIVLTQASEIPRMRIVAFNRNEPAKSLVILTKDFYSAQSPEISYDGKSMIFSAQLKENDPWQVWEMNLGNLKTRKISSCSENCADPVYLPGGRLVFSKLAVNDSLKAGYSLYTCDLSGLNVKRITFNPHSFISPAILRDGRVLTVDRQLYPDKGSEMFKVLRPDGTKAEIFYKGAEGSALKSRARETINGRLLFIESDSSNEKGGDIIAIGYNRPLHSRINLTSAIEGDFHAAFPLKSGHLLVSFRRSPSDRYALYEFDPEKKLLGTPILENPNYDILDAVVVEQQARPKKLPSEVDEAVKTGLLLCQDINYLNISPEGKNPSGPRASQIEVLGIDSTLGIVRVENDGSFYLKIMADKPFRIQTLDDKGNVLHGPCGWIWLRPNERRGCIGCHENMEMVPENRIPLAVKRSPVMVPVHISRVVEKKISLE